MLPAGLMHRNKRADAVGTRNTIEERLSNRCLAFPLILERQLYLGAIGFDLAVLEL
jgi:hypothetical protein